LGLQWGPGHGREVREVYAALAPEQIEELYQWLDQSHPQFYRRAA